MPTIPPPDTALKTGGSYKSDSSPPMLKYIFPSKVVCPEHGTWGNSFSNTTAHRSPGHSRGGQFRLWVSQALAAPPGLMGAADPAQGPPCRTQAQIKALLQLQKLRLKGLLPH